MSNVTIREAALVLPATASDIEVQHSDLLEEVVKKFGGFTLIPAIGGWRNPETGEVEVEPVIRVIIACSNTIGNDLILGRIADKFGAKYDQKAVYLRYPDGGVEIRPVAPPPGEQAAE